MHIYANLQTDLGDGRTHGAPYCGHGYVPLRFGGNVVMRMGTQQQRTSVPGAVNYGYVPLSHLGNIVMRIKQQQHKQTKLNPGLSSLNWRGDRQTDSVPWILSAEPPGEHRYENWIKTNTNLVVSIRLRTWHPCKEVLFHLFIYLFFGF